MENNRVTQHYWNQYRVDPVKVAGDPHREKQRFLVILKKQLKYDPITITLSSIAILLLVVMIISQILIATGRISGPVYL